ncbi:MAG TPA: DUF5685 family protein [Clostridiales bacterium]|nr:DUF5685 family protein [Clostridiales bacterium]
MFGYIMPEKPELKIKEYEMFKAFYCGVCKSIGKRIGQIPRVALNYDSTFLAILLFSLSDSSISIIQERCMLHPVKKKNIAAENEIVDYAADMNIILAYYNLKDDKIDNHNFVSSTGMFFLSPYYKKLKHKYKEKCDIIEKKLNELFELENRKCDSIDEVAEPFSKIMEEVMAYEPLCADKKVEKMLRWMGYNLGKWIYILDAYDDMEEDARNKKYNPLLVKYWNKNSEKNKINEEINQIKNEIKERIEFVLIYSLDQVIKTYELMDAKKVKGIIENIIYIGMLRKTEKILGTGSCRSFESI